MEMFERGDIVRLNLKSKLNQMNRTCLVLSTHSFNQLGLSYVAPIIQEGNIDRIAGFAVPLTGTETKGVALMVNVKALELTTDVAERIERAPENLINEALEVFNTIFE